MGDVHPRDGFTIGQLLRALREQVVSVLQDKPLDLTLEEVQEYEEGISDVLSYARRLVNSFHATIRGPPEILVMVCSYLVSEDSDLFSASQVCHHWRGVLISSPSLWTRFPCRHVPRTIISLERCKSMPIQLKVDRRSSSVALEKVLLRGAKIASLTVRRETGRTPSLHTLCLSPLPSVERLHIHSDMIGEERKVVGIWWNFPLLRELFASNFSVPIGQLTTPNLIHLALEIGGDDRRVALRSILKALRGCPLLETILIAHPHALEVERAPDLPPVYLPTLRSIELGANEVRSGLITHLHFPPSVAVGFRSLGGQEVFKIPPTVMASLQHVLVRIDVHTVALAAGTLSRGDARSLIRFEGVNGSLEITFLRGGSVVEMFLGDNSILLSFAPRLGTVKELQIATIPIKHRLLGRLATVMPNLTSICSFYCGYVDQCSAFEFMLPSTYDSLPPFPRLERLMVLDPGPGLMDMDRTRKECGVPLQLVVIGPEHRLYTSGQIMELREFAGDVRIEVPSDLLEWSLENRVLRTWSGTGIPGPETLTALRGQFKYCKFNDRERLPV